MPAVICPSLNMADAASFMERLNSGQCHLYVAVAKEDKWPGNNGEEIEQLEKFPPTPDTKLITEELFREKMIGIKQVLPANVMLVLPRRSGCSKPDGTGRWQIDWRPGNFYTPLDKYRNNPYVVSEDNVFYCLTSDFHVYKCLKQGTDSHGNPQPVQPYCEPSSLFGPNNVGQYQSVTTSDGYEWRFEYDIPARFININMLLEYWIPVPFGRHGEYIETPNQTPTGTTVHEYSGGTLTRNQIEHGNTYANYDLGAHHVVVNVRIRDEEEAIPYNIEYRQIGLILDPRAKNGELLHGNHYKAKPVDVAAENELDINSGHLIYLENCRVKTRQPNQTEQFLAVISF